MNTPIFDFVREYEKKKSIRLHMPGHKGNDFLGFEKHDITEIDGADSLFEAEGIILESEKNAGEIFGCDTFYSCEGSSLCIRAMLYLACAYAVRNNKKPFILAGRNAHKSFFSAAALLDFECEWLYPEDDEIYLSCKINTEKLDDILFKMKEKPTAVYITSPDYLGNTCDIGAISKICHKHGVLLLVDNAHGAYLRFLPNSLHPIDLGADLCCDSAHKTLPVLTGGAYLHINNNVSDLFSSMAKNALALFASTSPSYLILQSLDMANRYLYSEFSAKLEQLTHSVYRLKDKLIAVGYTLIGDESTKITISTKPYGYNGNQFAKLLLKKNIVCEFYDNDFVVLMFTPELGEIALKRIEETLLSIKRKTPILSKPPVFSKAEKIMNIREAVLSPCKVLHADECEGQVLSFSTVGCPPAVPIVAPGERINKMAIDCFKYYGYSTCLVVDKKQ